jgi:Na+/H+ antiporter NhaA
MNAGIYLAFWGLIVGLLFGIVIGGLCGERGGIVRMQKEAIRLNLAEWVADPQGNAKWQWKTK